MARPDEPKKGKLEYAFGVWLDEDDAGRVWAAADELGLKYGQVIRLAVQEGIARVEALAAKRLARGRKS